MQLILPGHGSLQERGFLPTAPFSLFQQGFQRVDPVPGVVQIRLQVSDPLQEVPMPLAHRLFSQRSRYSQVILHTGQTARIGRPSGPRSKKWMMPSSGL